MNAQILIQAVIQQATVFVGQLATAGGLRAPLSSVATQVFLDLSTELQNQGVKKNVIASMFGLTLRTYHRRVHELSQSQSVEGRSIWEAVLDYVRQKEPVSAGEIHRRFARDEREVVAGVLSDLVAGGFCYRTGRGGQAVYRLADDADFAQSASRERDVANEYLVWQAVYRNSPLALDSLRSMTRLSDAACQKALDTLLADGRVERVAGEGEAYTSSRLEVLVGQTQGWEAAVFDHFQAVLNAICAKLAQGENRSGRDDHTGGTTYSLDLWPGHPLEAEVLASLERVRQSMDDLRARLDQVNAAAGVAPSERLVFYAGQHLQRDRLTGDDE